jgi:hypothetical protein
MTLHDHGSADASATIPPSWTVACRPVALILAAVSVLATQADPDLWGHVQYGMDTLRDRALPRVDPYSFTQDRAWVNHEWLTEVMMGAAYRWGGMPGLLLLKALLAGSVFALAWKISRGLAQPWRWPLLALAVAGTRPVVMTLRPHLWSLLYLAILAHVLMRRGRWLWALPPLFVIWANSHGGWVLGLGLLTMWTAITAWEASGAERRRVGLAWAGSVAGTLVTPYGLELWHFIGTTVRMSRPDITEWGPLWDHPLLALLVWIPVTVTLGLYAWRVRAPRLAETAVILMLAVASVKVVRLVPLYALWSVLLVSGPSRPERRGTEMRVPRWFDAGLTALVIGLLAVTTGTTRPCIDMPEVEVMPDPQVLASLEQARPTGRMVTFFDWGQAALFHLGPSLKVSVDGRRETIYSPETLAEQYAIMHGTDEGIASLQRLAPDYVWLPLPTSEATARQVEDLGYRIDIRTARSFLATRHELAAILPREGFAPSGCFPGP